MKIILTVILFLVSTSASPRDMRQVRLFRHDHPCPATQSIRGACSGYVVDHIVPLCAGGADSPSNMQWQTIEDAKKKDVLEKKQCRRSHNE